LGKNLYLFYFVKHNNYIFKEWVKYISTKKFQEFLPLGIEKCVIIEDLYRNRQFNEAISKLIPTHLQHDAKHEVFIALYDKEEKEVGFLERGYSEGWVVWYMIRTVMNFSRGSKFHREYFKSHEEIDNIEDNKIEEYDFERDEKLTAFEQQVTDCFQNLHWTDREIFNVYLQGENMVEFSRKTMIPYRSLKHIIKRVKDTIKQQYHDSINSNSIDDLPARVCKIEQRESMV